MIIARAFGESKADGSPGELLILGLSDHNVARLLAGKPIRITQETHGNGVPAGWSIMIFHGKTEDEMAQMLKEGGAIGPDTEIRRDPKLGRSPNT